MATGGHSYDNREIIFQTEAHRAPGHPPPPMTKSRLLLSLLAQACGFQSFHKLLSLAFLPWREVRSKICRGEGLTLPLQVTVWGLKFPETGHPTLPCLAACKTPPNYPQPRPLEFLDLELISCHLEGTVHSSKWAWVFRAHGLWRTDSHL